MKPLVVDLVLGLMQKVLKIDTKANILSSTPAERQLAFSTDTNEFCLYDGSEWRQSPIVFGVIEDTTDIGAIVFSRDWGYGQTHLSDKVLHNTQLAYFNESGRIALVSGAIRWNPDEGDEGKVQVYVDDEWKNLETFTNDEFQDLMEWDDFKNNEIAPNGNQYIHGNQIDMGAFPSDHIITGGEIVGI